MAYIGNQPTDNFVTFATQNFSTSATSSYTLSHAVSNENEIALFINNVRQHPGSGKAYTASGTALTLSENTASTDVMYCIFLGRAIQSTVPATNSITAAMIGDTAISGKDALASEPADTDEFLVSDAGVLKRIDYSLIKGGGITEADQWRITANFQGDADPLSANLERVDSTGWGKLGTGMSVSSGIWTFPSTGIWKIEFNLQAYHNGQEQYTTAKIRGTTDNSSYSDLANSDSGMENSSGANVYHISYTQTLFDCTDTSTHKVKFVINSEDNSNYIQGSSSTSRTYMMFTKLGDT